MKQTRGDTVDLNDSDFQIDISDALSEKEKVKFTVHTKVRYGLFSFSSLSLKY